MNLIIAAVAKKPGWRPSASAEMTEIALDGHAEALRRSYRWLYAALAAIMEAGAFSWMRIPLFVQHGNDRSGGRVPWHR